MVVWPSGRNQYAAFVAAHALADLAAIVVDADSTTPSVPIAQTHPVIGDQICQVGYPHGKMTKRVGMVNGYVATKEGVRLFVPSFNTDHGDSGSGIFLTRERALCGVVWGGDGRNAVGVEWKVCKSFVEEQCCFWRRPQSPTGPAPVKPGPVLQAPVLPAVASAHEKIAALEAKLAALEARLKADLGQVGAKVDGLHGTMQTLPVKLADLEGKLTGLPDWGSKILDLDAKLHGHGGKLGTIEDKIKGLADLDARLQGHGGKLSTIEDKIKALPDLAALDSKLHGIGGKLEKLPLLSPEKMAAVEGTIGKVAALDGLVGWAGWMPAIAAGGATGGLSLLIPLAMGAFKLIRGAKARSDQSGPPQSGAAPPQQTLVPTQMPLVQAGPVILTGPPTPQLTRVDHTYVPFQAQSPELEAMKQAMDEVVKRNPGAVDLIDTIKNYARQIESGSPKKGQ